MIPSLAATLAAAAAPVSAPPPAPPVEIAAPSPEQAAGDPQAVDPGTIVVTARGKAPPDDPLQGVNAQSFEVVQGVDRAVIGPVAYAYQRNLPGAMRQGVHNVLTELEEPTVFVNDLLQLKPGRALKTLARFTINATLGLGGLIDVAGSKRFNLPHRCNGFANTMGYYGIGPGPYLYLPLIGSSSLRDFPGRLMDLALLPTAVGVPFKGAAWGIGRGTLASIDDRLAIDSVLNEVRDNSPDPYAALKAWYQAKRKAEIEALHSRKGGERKPAE